MITLVFPAYNEQDSLEELYNQICPVINKLSNEKFEILFIDDCSSDNTPAILRRLNKKDKRVKVVRLTSNCGAHAAITAGLNEARGDCAIVMSADLQDPPELIVSLLEKWRAGGKIVWGMRANSKDKRSRINFFSKLYYIAINRMTSVKVPPLGADVFLADRVVIEAFKQIFEKHTSIFMTLAWLGFPQEFIEYTKGTRHGGKSKWTLNKKIKLFIDSILSFSYLPIRYMSTVGFFTALCGFFYALLVFFKYIFLGIPVEGWSSLIIIILGLGGIQMIMLGVLGEYLWRTFDESRRRPLYYVEYRID